MQVDAQDRFLASYNGYFKNMLRWDDLDRLWATLKSQAADQWYVYAVGETPPTAPTPKDKLGTFIEELDRLLHREHDEDYCGIVYADNEAEPGFIKVYDPNNLGSVCGSSSLPPPFPGWILSTIPPVDLNVAIPLPGNRKRWWQQLFG